MAVAAGQRRPFSDHLSELRTRLGIVVVFFALFSGFTFWVHDKAISLLQSPLGQPLFYGTPSGGFQLLMQVCMLGGLFGALPILLYNIAKFVEPAFENNISGFSLFRLVLLSVVLMASGIAFGFLLILPISLHFFMSFSTTEVKSLITTDAYFGFVTSILATFAILFQLPLVMLFWNHISPLKPGRLMSYLRYVVLGSFVLALVLPFTYDPLTQTLMALPLILLYLLSVVLIWSVNRKTKVKKAAIKQVEQIIAEPIVQPITPQYRPIRHAGRVIDLRAIDLPPK